ncbi:MAG: hypothetical protein R3C05_26630 [Pirellulaceae bacterium]
MQTRQDPRQQMPQPVVDYLHRLEISIKRRSGVVPEAALEDAREHLLRDYEAFLRTEPGLSDDDVLALFVESFGEPDVVSRQYEDLSDPILMPLPGIAPQWRICCTRCGRSAPAARVGITRIGARSIHKYTLGWCRDCRWFRILKLQRDMQSTNLTDAMTNGASRQGHRNRSTSRRTSLSDWRFFCRRRCYRCSSSLVQLLIAKERSPHAGVFENLPSDWTLVQQHDISIAMTKQLAQRWGPTSSTCQTVFFLMGGLSCRSTSWTAAIVPRRTFCTRSFVSRKAMRAPSAELTIKSANSLCGRMHKQRWRLERGTNFPYCRRRQATR